MYVDSMNGWVRLDSSSGSGLPEGLENRNLREKSSRDKVGTYI